ncbi:hypothetical protein AVEN_179130-1 [Araneus ventricosus]|uniref:Uncharacterized protein n=1 Tax=Araneus ventricosus TaxID=182803 RepID=A0A4Y2JT91_ARAVE|nr:hypothetical protein AVEN_173554-1 [Araneus ventricosus]GBM93628.1 hypothetical protein AVEN_179130-1 [Araneus ventricosus]
MDSKIQVKKTSVTGGTGCKQPGKKKAKEKEFSVESLHVPPLAVNPRVITSWFTITTCQTRRILAARWSESKSESFDLNPIHRGLFWYPPLGWELGWVPHVNNGTQPDSHPNRGYQNRPLSYLTISCGFSVGVI